MPNNVVTQKILILASNVENTSRLRLNQEVREIDEGLYRAKHRDQFELVQRWAVRPRDIYRAMLDINPNIVHFAGHGVGEEGLIFENEIGQPKFVTREALAGLFELFSNQVECVVLNGCYSQVQAEIIAQYIPYVIGMQQAIDDKAAVAFAVGFYDALGAGCSFEFSYKLGCNAIQMEGILEHLTPALIKKNSNLSNFKHHTSLKQQIEAELGLCFFDNLIQIVRKRVENFSDMQAAYYTGVIITGVEERFTLTSVENFIDEQSFTFWFLLKGLAQLDLSRQQKIIGHIQRKEFEHENATMLAIHDLINAAGGEQGEHYYQYGDERVPLDAGWELLDRVFKNDEFTKLRDLLIENTEQ